MPNREAVMVNRNSKASPLSAKTNQQRNTKAGRAKMPGSDFAIPSQKAYRIDDAPHARDALSRVQANGTPQEKAQVRAAVAKKYPDIKQTKGAQKGTTGKTTKRK